MERSCGSAQPDMPSMANTATLFDALSADAISVIVKQMESFLQKYEYMDDFDSPDSKAEEPMP